MRLLTWYRVDRGNALRRGLMVSVAFMAVGATVAGLPFLVRAPTTIRILAAVVALMGITAGPILAMRTSATLLAEDEYVGISRDGLVLHLRNLDEVLPWDSIERISHRPEETRVLIELRSGEVMDLRDQFAGTSQKGLANALETARRKASFKLLA